MMYLSEFMNLSDTVDLMNSDDYEDRFKAEYFQTELRYERLHKIVLSYESGKLKFKPKCSLELLKHQKSAMGQYLYDLELRAMIEDIDLRDIKKLLIKYKNGYVKHFKRQYLTKDDLDKNPYKYIYIIKGTAINTTNSEEMVVYQEFKSDSNKREVTYVRPFKEFFSKVDTLKYPDSIQEYRFEKLSDDELNSILSK